jgi:hypothetical protein
MGDFGKISLIFFVIFGQPAIFGQKKRHIVHFIHFRFKQGVKIIRLILWNAEVNRLG